MRLLSLSAQAFRGIREPVELNLEAAVTLLYAPNGSGKTSLCDAAEWLLTARVDRLPSLNPEELRCGFADSGLEAYAAARLEVQGTKIIHVKRTTHQRPDSPMIGTDERSLHRSSDSVLLELLVGDRAPSDTTQQNTNRNRRVWLRAARLLESSSLALLLDSSPDATEARRLAFAKLLGLGQIEEDGIQLTRVREALPPLNRLETLVLELEAQVTRLEHDLHAEQRRSWQAMLDSASPLLERAAARLRRERGVQPQLLPDDRVIALTAALNAAEGDLAMATSAVDSIRAAWPGRLEIALRAERARVEGNALGEALQEANRALAEVREALATATSERAGLLVLQEELAEFASDLTEIRGHLMQLRDRSLALGGEVPRKAPEASALVHGARERLKQAEARSSVLGDCFSECESWQQVSVRRTRLQAELESIRVRLAGGDEALLEAERARVREALEAEEDAHRQAAGAAGDLRRAAMAWLDLQAAQADCPLCGHAWDTAAELRRAAQSALDGLPLAVAALEERTVVLGREVARLDRVSAERRQLQRRLEELQDALAEAEASLSTAAQTMRAAGLSDVALGEVDLGALVIGASRSAAQEENAAREALSRAEEILDVVVGFEQLGAIIAEAEGKLASVAAAITRPPARPPAHEPGASALEARQATVEREAAALRAEVDERLRAHETSLIKRRRDAALVEARRQEAATKAEAARMTAAKAAGELADLRRQVEALRPWGLGWDRDESMARCEEKLAGRRSDLAKAASEIAEGGTLLDSASDTRAIESQLSRSRGELEQARHQLTFWAAWHGHLGAGIDTLRSYRKERVAATVGALSSQISAIYSRAQANRVIDQVEASPDADGSIRWSARGGSVTLDDMAQLSQGQRQDLALAIFLARARALGGTFILDEPFLHLDELNRVGVLDVIRALVIQSPGVNLLVTTASRDLALLLREKFALVPRRESASVLRVYELVGNPRDGARVREMS